MTQARPFDLTHNPVGLWNFAGNLSDSSGNGFDLTAEQGTARYAQMLPGINGLHLDGATTLWHNVADTDLAIPGDLTVQVMARLLNESATDARLVAYVSNTSAGENDNTLYSYGLSSVSVYRYQYQHRSGAFVQRSYETTADGSDFLGPVLLGVTRIGNVIQQYRNGLPFGAPSSALVAPTGGFNARFKIGGGVATTAEPIAIIGGVKLCISALTSDEMKAEYNRTLGRALGMQP